MIWSHTNYIKWVGLRSIFLFLVFHYNLGRYLLLLGGSFSSFLIFRWHLDIKLNPSLILLLLKFILQLVVFNDTIRIAVYCLIDHSETSFTFEGLTVFIGLRIFIYLWLSSIWLRHRIFIDEVWNIDLLILFKLCHALTDGLLLQVNLLLILLAQQIDHFWIVVVFRFIFNFLNLLVMLGQIVLVIKSEALLGCSWSLRLLGNDFSVLTFLGLGLWHTHLKHGHIKVIKINIIRWLLHLFLIDVLYFNLFDIVQTRKIINELYLLLLVLIHLLFKIVGTLTHLAIQYTLESFNLLLYLEFPIGLIKRCLNALFVTTIITVLVNYDILALFVLLRHVLRVDGCLLFTLLDRFIVTITSLLSNMVVLNVMLLPHNVISILFCVLNHVHLDGCHIHVIKHISIHTLNLADSWSIWVWCIDSTLRLKHFCTLSFE